MKEPGERVTVKKEVRAARRATRPNNVSGKNHPASPLRREEHEVKRSASIHPITSNREPSDQSGKTHGSGDGA